MRVEKSRYLFLYDYGTGGVWIFVKARSPDEVLKEYPSLRLMDESKSESDIYPPNLSRLEKADIDARMTYDIDDPPRDFLLALLDKNEPKT